jgi:hypothetical protein
MPDCPPPAIAEPRPLQRTFDRAYLDADDDLWCLPTRQQSLLLLRRVCVLARSFRMPQRLSMATHGHVVPSEYAIMARIADTPAAEMETRIRGFHDLYPGHPYPIELLDPLRRRGRWP